MKWIGRLILILIGAAVCLGLYLVSPQGMQRVAARIESAASSALKTPVAVDQLRLHWPLQLSLRSFQVGDESDPYLRVERVHVQISSRALLRGSVRIRRLTVRHIRYRDWPAVEQPVAADDAVPAETQWSGLPASLGPVRQLVLEDAHIERMEIGDLAVGMRGAMDVDLEQDQLVTQWHVTLDGSDETQEWPLLRGDVHVRADLRSSRMFTIPVLEVAVECEELWVRDMPLRNVAVGIEGDGRTVRYELSGEGEWAEPWTSSVAGQVEVADGQLLAAQIRDLQARYGELDVTLTEPVDVRRELDGYRLEQMRIQIGPGVLQAAGFVGRNELDLAADLFDVPLSMFGFGGVSPAQGEFRGKLRAQGDLADPDVLVEFLFSDLLPANAEYWEGPPAEFSARFHLAQGRLQSDLQLQGPASQPVTVNVNAPLVISLLPFYVEWPPQGDVVGRMHAESDLSELAQLFVLDVHRVSGLFRMDLSVSGTVDEPVLMGRVEIKDGKYEHDLLGTRLRDVEVAFSGERDRLQLDTFSATDGRGGRVSMRGSIALRAAEEYPFEGELDLRHFRLMQNDTLRTTGDGRVQWEGNRQASRVHGAVHVGPVEVAIPERLPAAMIDLDVIELDGPEPPEDTTPAPGFQHDLQLDVVVSVPDRFFVRGRGLDSEWGGEIHIRGTALEPVVTGSLAVIRGRFVFFGRRLALTRGIITFDGSVPPQPGLDIVAEARTREMIAIMRLFGAVDAPEIVLESIPTLPQDEILARLLFGRDAERITPWQAVMIAQAVNQLRGGGSAFDVMGQTRRFLRVDQIELRDDEENGEMTLTVGKYVSDRIYVELERGGGGEGTRVAVEVELTPTLRLDSEVGTEAEAGVGLSWQWDF